MDQTIRPCQLCKSPATVIAMEFDGHIVDMESCDHCDTRRWSRAGEPIDLPAVLDQVGTHSGRRR